MTSRAAQFCNAGNDTASLKASEGWPAFGAVQRWLR
jgi:hypothetical protein